MVAGSEVGTRLTVVVPAWDTYSSLLPGVLDDLSRQDIPLRVVVVDNSSSTPVVAPTGVELVQLPARVTTGQARNAGLERVDTEFVTFLDLDDRLLPGALRLLADNLASEPDAVAAVGRLRAWHPQHQQTFEIGFPTAAAAAAARAAPHHLGVLGLVKNQYPVVGPAVLRTDAVRDAGGFGPWSYCEDWALATSLAFRGRVLIHADELLLCRFHAGSQITRHGSGRGVLAMLPKLHLRWLRDRAIPLCVKARQPFLAAPRVWTGLQRVVNGVVSHDDVLGLLGRPSLHGASERASKQAEADASTQGGASWTR